MTQQLKTRKNLGGRPPGSPNKITQATREAIGLFVNDNVASFQEWLNQVANGVPKRNEKNEVIRNDAGEIVWQIRPDPEKAFYMAQSVIEYHVPKLARTETNVSGNIGLVDFLTGLPDPK